MAVEFSPDVLKRAHEAIRQGAVEPDADYEKIWWVKSTSGGPLPNTYRVQADYDPTARTLRWITCTCPHGLHVGAGETHCYHAAAVLITLADELQRDPEALAHGFRA